MGKKPKTTPECEQLLDHYRNYSCYGKSNKYLLDVTNLIDESAERRLTQREFENVVDDYLSDLGKRQVEEAKKAAIGVMTQ